MRYGRLDRAASAAAEALLRVWPDDEQPAWLSCSLRSCAEILKFRFRRCCSHHSACVRAVKHAFLVDFRSVECAFHTASSHGAGATLFRRHGPLHLPIATRVSFHRAWSVGPELNYVKLAFVSPSFSVRLRRFLFRLQNAPRPLPHFQVGIWIPKEWSGRAGAPQN